MKSTSLQKIIIAILILILMVIISGVAFLGKEMRNDGRKQITLGNQPIYHRLYIANQNRLSDIFYIVNMWEYYAWDKKQMRDMIWGIINDTTYLLYNDTQINTIIIDGQWIKE